MRQMNYLKKSECRIRKKISMIDELTAITNRRGFDIAFQKAWGELAREKSNL